MTVYEQVKAIEEKSVLDVTISELYAYFYIDKVEFIVSILAKHHNLPFAVPQHARTLRAALRWDEVVAATGVSVEKLERTIGTSAWRGVRWFLYEVGRWGDWAKYDRKEDERASELVQRLWDE